MKADYLDLPIYIYVLACLGGVVAGFINTIAGSGSLITLPILMFLGLPAHIANGTNRVGILFQSFIGSATLKSKGNVHFTGTRWMMALTVIGAFFGALSAVQLSEEMMHWIICGVMVVMLFVIIFNSEKFISGSMDEGEIRKNPLTIIALLCAGFYGGFIQAGVGVLLLISMVVIAGMNLVKANAVKNAIVFLFTIPAIAIFIYNDQVNWQLGLLLAVGQMTGAWLAARFATENQQASVWIRRLLIAIIVISIIELLGLRKLLMP